MRKIWGTILEALGFSKEEAETVIKLLAAHLTLEVVLTIVILVLTIAVPILISRPLADRFDRRAKARDRQERVDDIALAAYHEIFISWIAMVKAFGSPGATEDLVKLIEGDDKYFPFYTFDASAPDVSESYVKTDIAIFPTELIHATITYYHSSQFFSAYLLDSRSDKVAALSARRKIGFVRNLHSTAYEHMAVACDALVAYEDYVDKLSRKKRRLGWCWKHGLRWEREKPDLLLNLAQLTTTEIFGAHVPASPLPYTLEQRRQIYRNLEKELNDLAKKTSDGIVLSVKPAGGSEAKTS